MYLVLVMIAAVAYTVGGIYMKLSAGLSQLVPSLFVYLFFATGASLQTLAMDKSDLGGTYILVLCLECIFALLGSVMLFKENYSFLKLLGVSLIVTGTIFLRSGDS